MQKEIDRLNRDKSTSDDTYNELMAQNVEIERLKCLCDKNEQEIRDLCAIVNDLRADLKHVHEFGGGGD
jgi:hypothetical protein